MARVAVFVSVFVLAGCGANAPYAADCAWPPHERRPLSIVTSADARHLADDAQIAEDIAIRHADLVEGTAGREPGRYRQVRETCKAALFAQVSDQHAVSRDEVARAVAHRRSWLDAAVMLAFAAIYGLIARVVAQRLFRGAMADSLALSVAITLVTALALSFVGVLAGGVWSGLIESLRVGNGHISYRVERVPWRQYPVPLFISGVALFMCVAATTWKAQRRSA